MGGRKMPLSVSRTRIVVVLVEPKEDGNIGAAARALKNTGLGGLRLVRPPQLGVQARRMAWRSLDVLRRARSFPSLPAALADCVRAIGFTARPQRTITGIRPLPALAPVILKHAERGRVALVFGPENRGLSRDELGCCQDVVRIPASPRQPSFNLAQAVLLVGYELLVAGHGLRVGRAVGAGSGEETRDRGGLAPAQNGPPKRPASVEDILAVEAAWADGLKALGYGELRRGALADRILRRWRSIFDRAALTREDVWMLRGVAKQMLWLARRAGAAAPDSRAPAMEDRC
jgi:tRNA/rRNA methyltransferase